VLIILILGKISYRIWRDDWVSLNTCSISIFVIDDATSIINVAFYKNKYLQENWKVLVRDSYNYHTYLDFVVNPSPITSEPTTVIISSWSLKRIDLEPFAPFLAQIQWSQKLQRLKDSQALYLLKQMSRMTVICDVSMPLQTQGPIVKRPVYRLPDLTW